jgi:hypothetical protein
MPTAPTPPAPAPIPEKRLLHVRIKPHHSPQHGPVNALAMAEAAVPPPQRHVTVTVTVMLHGFRRFEPGPPRHEPTPALTLRGEGVAARGDVAGC